VREETARKERIPQSPFGPKYKELENKYDRFQHCRRRAFEGSTPVVKLFVR